MVKEHLFACVAVVALGLGPALAQTNQPATPPAQTGTATETVTADKMSADTWRASKLIGVGIYGPDDQRVGEVNEILVDRQGKAQAIVVGVGGFLGIGEKNVAIPFGEVEWSDQPVNPPPAAAPGTQPAPADPSAAPGTTPPAAGTTPPAPGTTPPAAGTTPPAADTPPPATEGTTGMAETKRMYPDHGRITMTRQQLNDAPSFEYPG
ncbi:PRC-barrel domain-containing protein [Inquilinus limosus]|uniref:PRC-barrel domain-containing protein n=1 Tax=Inquilinus limosus TaxID=171674 RepID=UPI00041D31E7|nr:PRC-barrel domain-containing protein [Inquilinus limosus]